MRFGILAKLLSLGVLLTMLPLLAIWAINNYQNNKAITFAAEETRQLAEKSLDQTLNGVFSMLTSQQELLEKVVDGNLNVTFDLAKEYGGLHLGETTWQWNAVNQFSKKSTLVELPQMYIGDKPIAKLSDFSTKSPLVDDVGRLLGGTSTIFQRMDQAGSMLRVATNVEKLDKTRATGTYIPAMNPNGQPNPVIKAIMQGQRFVGRAYVVNAWYVTAYEPFYDANKNIIGVLYYGVREDSAKSLREQIMSISIGKNGGVFILDSNGQIIISPQGKRDGEMVLNELDANAMPYIKDIVDQAVQFAPGDMGSIVYTQKQGEEIRNRLAKFTYFKKWDWIIVAAGDEKELFVLVDKLTTLCSSNQVSSISLLIGSLLLIGLIWLLMAKRFVRPIKEATKVAQAIASGDLDAKMKSRSSDEIGQLSNSLNTMAGKLRKMIQDFEEKSAEAENEAQRCRLASEQAENAVRQAENARREGMIQASGRIESLATQLNHATEQFHGTVDQASRGANKQSMRAEETATAMEQMNAAVLEVAKNASSSAEASDEARTKAQLGAKVVSQVVAAISQVRNKAQELKSNMADLDRQAEAIDQVMNVITDIADQTNLLALNAAIEAARAGEAGRGFAVVADEVRKLAEKTMAATKEVGTTVMGIQNGTRSNVQNVEQAVELVEHATGLAEQSGDALSEIVTLVEAVSDQVRSIATASEQQSSTSEEINRSFEEINRISQETDGVMQEASQAVNELVEHTHALQDLVVDLRGE